MLLEGKLANIEKRINKDGKVSYRVKVRLKGTPSQSATFDRLTDAKRWVQQTETAIREGRHFKGIEAKRHTLRDVTDRYIKYVLPLKPKSRVDQERHLVWWANEIGNLTLADVTPVILSEKRDLLHHETTVRKTQRSPATVNRYLASLSHAFTIAVKEWGWMDENPIGKVGKFKESRGRVRYLLDEERKSLLNACKESSNQYIHLVVVLALSTGARKSELMNLTWQCIDFDNQRIILEFTKNNERRALPLKGLALQMLTEHSKVRHLNTELLFPGSNPEKPLDLRKAWKAVLKNAEIVDFRFHDLRHSAASYLAMNGATPGEIAEILGHKTLQMVKRYAHLSEAHTAKVVEKMNEQIF